MAKYTCSICGGETEISDEALQQGVTVGTCEYCGSAVTIPKTLTRNENYYNRATFLRQSNEFDKAALIYEDILKEDNDDSEAHWGLLLCRYGIEYIEDPSSGKRLPTCHRLHTSPILSDPDYLSVLEHASPDAKAVYAQAGEEISAILTHILEISQKESPYDVFLCYKETNDVTGERTQDSVLAQELYYGLTKKGYRVFFSRKTLESRLGDEFEPIIYSALHSARVMVVLGTKPEYFNAVWVKNEWSRFLRLTKQGNKSIIPAYRDISPYELPAELSSLQSQDMGKIGFMQDLTDGLEKLMKGSAHSPQASGSPAAFNTWSLARLLKNGETYLNLKNYTAAQEVYHSITKNYPEEYRGWWGKIVCVTREFSEPASHLEQCNTWLSYVRQLASPEEFAPLCATYLPYLQNIISPEAAKKDLSAIEKLLRGHRGTMSQLQADLDKEKAANDAHLIELNNQSQSVHGDIAACQALLKNQQSKLKFFHTRLTVGWISLFVGIMVFTAGGSIRNPNVLTAGACLFILGIIFITTTRAGNKNAGGWKVCTQASTQKLNALTLQAQQLDTEKRQAVAAFDAMLTPYNELMEVYERKCEQCNAYLNLGVDGVSPLWYAWECQSIGMEQPIDQSVKKIRELALEAPHIPENKL